jgi:hypothetical protein
MVGKSLRIPVILISKSHLSSKRVEHVDCVVLRADGIAAVVQRFLDGSLGVHGLHAKPKNCQRGYDPGGNRNDGCR